MDPERVSRRAAEGRSGADPEDEPSARLASGRAADGRDNATTMSAGHASPPRHPEMDLQGAWAKCCGGFADSAGKAGEVASDDIRAVHGPTAVAGS